MTINYGKRNPGGLTASNPGDTLYIPFATYNDSGASIGMTGFAVTDIKIFKDGNLTTRATDSGYSLITDTGQYGDRAGLYRFSIQLFNTSDAPSFFAAGSQYHVAIDAITVDARTVRLFPAVFEIGTERANVVQIVGDTGAAAHLQQAAAASSNLLSDTGAVATAVWAKDVRALTAFAHDTGVSSTVWAAATRSLTANAVDTGVFTGTAAKANDTGALVTSIWSATTREATAVSGAVGSVTGNVGGSVASVTTVSANAVDTGSFTGTAAKANDTGVVVNSIWAATSRVLTANTNLAGLAVNVDQLDGDTGAADVLGKFAETKLSAAGDLDTGSGSLLSVSSVSGAVGSVTGSVGSVTAVVTANVDQVDGDTGAADQLQKAFDTTPTYLQQVDLRAVLGDTGAAHLDAGRLGVSASATVDTGVINNAVWNGNVSDHVADTGSFGYAQGRLLAVKGDTGAAHLDAGRLGVSATATVDTGVINNAVWNGNVSDHVADTGAFGYAQGRLMAVKGDTGAAHLDAGRLGVTATATVDTGLVNNAVWNGLRADHVAAGSFGQYVPADTQLIDGDTGAATHLQQGAAASERLLADTGAIATATWAKDIRVLTANTNLAGLSVDVQQLDGDTGAADVLGKFAETKLGAAGDLDTGSGSLLSVASVSGSVGSVTAVVTANVDQIDGDTGPADNLGRIAADTGTGSYLYRHRDTGGIADAIWAKDVRSLTAFNHDTGVSSTVWAAATRTLTANTNLAGLAVNVDQLDGDTGAADVLGKFAETKLGATGAMDTGTGSLLSVASVSGSVNSVTSTVTANVDQIDGDTGAADQLQKAFDTTPAYLQQVDLRAVLADTGAAHLDAGRLGVTATASTDTGAVNNAVWNGLRADHTAAGSFGQYVTANADLLDGDTGAADVLGKFAESKLSAAGQVDTGTLAGTQAGTIDANITYVNETAVIGTGDTGLGDTWRPA